MTDRDFSVEVTDTPDVEALARVSDGLAAFNSAQVGPSNRRSLAIFLRETGEVIGGLSGYTAWGWLFVQQLWIADTHRGKGHAATLLGEAEVEAIRRGCEAAWIDTFNPVALNAYRRHGYVIFGELPEFPKGRSRYFLQKRLV